MPASQILPIYLRPGDVILIDAVPRVVSSASLCANPSYVEVTTSDGRLEVLTYSAPVLRLYTQQPAASSAPDTARLPTDPTDSPTDVPGDL